MKENDNTRIDRRPGFRVELERARKKIYATQTICGICGKPVDFSLKPPHPLSPTLDHIIPVSKLAPGQEYMAVDISNLQLAHRACNRAKSDKLTEEGVNKVTDEVISNRILPQSRDWASYKHDK